MKKYSLFIALFFNAVGILSGQGINLDKAQTQFVVKENPTNSEIANLIKKKPQIRARRLNRKIQKLVKKNNTIQKAGRAINRNASVNNEYLGQNNLSFYAFNDNETGLSYHVCDQYKLANSRNFETTFEDDAKIIRYTISKSTDDIHYTPIGTSISNNVTQLSEDENSLKMQYGYSSFKDTLPHKTSKIYYKVEGFYQQNPSEKIFEQKVIGQKRTVKGRVLDKRNGETLLGVTVILEGTTIGTQTDIDGNYELTVPTTCKRLSFLYVGYQTQTFEIGISNKESDTIFVSIALTEEPSIPSGPCYGHHWYDWRKGHIEAKVLENGATQLIYQVKDSLEEPCKNHKYHVEYYKDIEIQYSISKSTDDIHYKRIGSSYSDSTAEVNKMHTTFSWGMSQFLDKERNKADSTFYLVEGVYESNSNIILFREKVSVPPADYLKINYVSPEPQSNQINVKVTSPLSGKATFIVFDMAGRQLSTQQIHLAKKQNTIIVNTPDLPSGIYNLYVRQDGSYDNFNFSITK
jgi:hypothetical protein